MVFELTARNSESVIGVAAVALAGRPPVTLAILVGPVVKLRALLALSRTMLRLGSRFNNSRRRFRLARLDDLR